MDFSSIEINSDVLYKTGLRPVSRALQAANMKMIKVVKSVENTQKIDSVSTHYKVSLFA